MSRPQSKLPSLPALVEQKLTKTGNTRGATPKEIFQNRVLRNNTVLIAWEFWDACRTPDDGTGRYENGFIAIVEPSWYFTTNDPDALLEAEGLQLGQNALLLFRKRSDWTNFGVGRTKLPNGLPFAVAQSRTAPLGGTYFARVHATVATEDGDQIVRGYNTTATRGAGIRVYEYASKATIELARLQLEALIWLCADASDQMRDAGMTPRDIQVRRDAKLEGARDAGLLDTLRMQTLRMVDKDSCPICPLCLRAISAREFLMRGEQAEGRAVFDITITEVSLFHIEELRVGKLQHKPYNLGWGHHFCNVVVKDVGITRTLEWMQEVLANQGVAAGLCDEAALVKEVVEP